MFRQLINSSKTIQILISTGSVVLLSATCYFLQHHLGYKVVAFILLLCISLLAALFDIIPVLLAATLSALIWNFFFIEPKYTFQISTAEDGFLFAMYFIIASINAVLTNRIRQVEKKAREEEEKARTVKLYNTLLNSLSHELKTPIAAIISASDNLMSPEASVNKANQEELASNISVAALRLNQQVENLLSMSRIESGFLRPRQDWVDVNELIYEVVHRLEQQLVNHTPVITIADNLPLYKMDYGLMEQVLYNLIYNASLYTPQHTDIIIRARNKAEKVYYLDPDTEIHSEMKSEINTLILTIEDQGPGFPPGETERVFEKFYRLEHVKKGGTGLGLSIVKGFVEAHKGKITLENIPHGARFTIEIPAEVSYINSLKNE